jgi:hypothetical protein
MSDEKKLIVLFEQFEFLLVVKVEDKEMHHCDNLCLLCSIPKEIFRKLIAMIGSVNISFMKKI